MIVDHRIDHYHGWEGEELDRDGPYIAYRHGSEPREYLVGTTVTVTGEARLLYSADLVRAMRWRTQYKAQGWVERLPGALFYEACRLVLDHDPDLDHAILDVPCRKPCCLADTQATELGRWLQERAERLGEVERAIAHAEMPGGHHAD